MPTTKLSPDELAARSRRAVAAVTAAGRELGQQVDGPKALHDVFSVVVHLLPSPVVARTPAVLPRELSSAAQYERQARELAAVHWLAEHGCPVARPSPLVPRSPVQREGFSMTFWEFVAIENPAAEHDFVAQSALVPQLHAALREYPAQLPFLAPVAITVPGCLAYLERNPELLAWQDLERAQREWRVLEPYLTSQRGFSELFPRAHIQAIHGDAPFYNLLRTNAGIRYADFEDVTLGPPEWDLAGAGVLCADAYDAAARQAGLRPLDRDVLRVMDAARMLQVVACLALVPELPMLEAGLASTLESWRAMPFAAGLG